MSRIVQFNGQALITGKDANLGSLGLSPDHNTLTPVECVNNC